MSQRARCLNAGVVNKLAAAAAAAAAAAKGIAHERWENKSKLIWEKAESLHVSNRQVAATFCTFSLGDLPPPLKKIIITLPRRLGTPSNTMCPIVSLHPKSVGYLPNGI